MRRSIYLALFFLVAVSLHAQVGLSGHYLSGQAEKWQYTPLSTNQESVDLPGTGWQAGIDYWFRLKNVRIEFLPTLAYSTQEQTIEGEFNALDTRANAFHFFFNTNIYFLDLEGDCDCPTFSKQGPGLQKGIFLQLSPGYSLFDFSINNEAIGEEYTADDAGFNMGLALGLDLGIADVLTITPMIGARYYPSLTWSTLGEEAGLGLPEKVESESSLLQYHAGIRLGFRFDQ